MLQRKHTPTLNGLHTLLIALTLLFVAISSTAQAAGDRWEDAQERADRLYAEGDYTEAYRKYTWLAKQGDSFSQYRLSYMNFQGQGVDQDWKEAFAWALLAAQGNNPDLVKYMAALAQQMPEEHATGATVMAKDYMDRWGNLALAEDARREAERELRSCTGSRVGARCEQVYSMKMPRFWNYGFTAMPGTRPGSNNGHISSGTGNDIGGPVLNTRYYQALRWGVKDIEEFLVKNAGNVEIGELETIEN